MKIQLATWVLQFSCHFYFFVGLDDISDFNIVELIYVQTTLIIVFNFFDVVFEALQGA